MKTVVIIPARMDSKRLLGKPLMRMHGVSIIRLCYFSACNSDIADKIYVASPDPEILWEVCKMGGEPVETSNLPTNGTERVAEVARILQLAPDDIIVNLQGDMPFFDSEIIDEPIKKLKAIPECNVASVMTLLQDEDKNNPNRVKVTTDEQDRAMSFSREYGDFLHIGVYVFRNSFLQRYAMSAPSMSEIKDNLEQKRMDILDMPIWMSFVESRPVVIDCEEDLNDYKGSDW